MHCLVLYRLFLGPADKRKGIPAGRCTTKCFHSDFSLLVSSTSWTVHAFDGEAEFPFPPSHQRMLSSQMFMYSPSATVIIGSDSKPTSSKPDEPVGKMAEYRLPQFHFAGCSELIRKEKKQQQQTKTNNTLLENSVTDFH